MSVDVNKQRSARDCWKPVSSRSDVAAEARTRFEPIHGLLQMPDGGTVMAIELHRTRCPEQAGLPGEEYL